MSKTPPISQSLPTRLRLPLQQASKSRRLAKGANKHAIIFFLVQHWRLMLRYISSDRVPVDRLIHPPSSLPPSLPSSRARSLFYRPLGRVQVACRPIHHLSTYITHHSIPSRCCIKNSIFGLSVCLSVYLFVFPPSPPQGYPCLVARAAPP